MDLYQVIIVYNDNSKAAVVSAPADSKVCATNEMGVYSK
jgi:hypothetical protein